MLVNQIFEMQPAFVVVFEIVGFDSDKPVSGILHLLPCIRHFKS